jgi:hypothetical protein
MCLPKREEGFLAGGVGAGDAIQINLDGVCGRAALGDCARQAVCPFANQLPVQDNLGLISKVEDRGSQHA